MIIKPTIKHDLELYIRMKGLDAFINNITTFSQHTTFLCLSYTYLYSEFYSRLAFEYFMMSVSGGTVSQIS